MNSTDNIRLEQAFDQAVIVEPSYPDQDRLPNRQVLDKHDDGAKSPDHPRNEENNLNFREG